MFERLITLVGEDNLKKLQKVNILLVGVGGVGGYVFEALIRSGIQNITIIDGDVIEKSNLNRQIITNQNNIGLPKVEVAKKRGLEINPNLNIDAKYLFINEDNFNKILDKKYDYVVDACDDLNVKLLLIKNADKYKLIASMGTANKFNPSLFTITDLNKTSGDPIAKILRKKVKDLKIKTKFKVVSSPESPAKKGVLGTNSFIPGISGLLCASYVINDIIN
jgi:tRNA A37 threonylcarbamoyladenosine dehydratase